MIRLLDIILSLIGVVALLPIWLVIAIWIKLDSKGPVFFVQFRVGQWNRDFRLLKFRTMKVDAEQSGQLTVGGRDPRITKVGFILRKYKLDEFPQLLNVLMGNMSLVGPRPEVRQYVELYSDEQLKVLQVKPGVTDYASIEYSDENELLGTSEDPRKTYIEEIMPHKLLLNQRFLSSRSLTTYFRILGITLRKIVSR